MTHIEITAKSAERVLGRKCGSCTACCTYMGVNELQKHTGVKCPHLRGPSALSKRCGIYSSRPTACQAYQCLWLSGWGEAKLRPNLSGILITPYMDEETQSTIAFTIMVFDPVRARPHLYLTLAELLGLPNVTEVRLIDWKTQTATHFKHGRIYNCDILSQPPSSYESLTFTTTGEPIGTYSIRKEETNEV